MRLEWSLISVFAFAIGTIAILILKRRHDYYGAELVAASLGFYVFLVLLLVATEAKELLAPGVDLSRSTKIMLLAVSGGWLAQILFVLNRLANKVHQEGHIAPVFIKALLGALCGLVAVTLVSSTFSEFEAVADSTAGLAGVAGGTMGISVLDFTKSWFKNGSPAGGS